MNNVEVTRANYPRILVAASNAPILGLDSESYGPPLPGKSMLDVRRSTLMGFSFAMPNHLTGSTDAYYVPLRHAGENLPFHMAAEILQTIIENQKVWLHNLPHDFRAFKQEGLAIDGGATRCSQVACWLAGLEVDGKLDLKSLALKHLGRESPKFQLGMEKLPASDVLQYVCDDARNALELGELAQSRLSELELSTHFLEHEMPVLWELIHMGDRGMGLDIDRLRDLEKRCVGGVGEAQELWDQAHGLMYNPRSSPGLQSLFGPVWETEAAPYTKSGKNFSTSGDAMDYQLAACKEGSRGYNMAFALKKFKEFESVRSTCHTIDEAYKVSTDKRIHTNYRQTLTTGRIASSDTNLANIPVRSALGLEIKKCFVPREGYSLLAADYSQIELRILAHFAGPGALRDAYQKGEDIHQTTADLVNVSRNAGKTLNFAIIYGCSGRKVATLLGCGVAEGRRVAAALEDAYPELEALRTNIVKAMRSRKVPYVKTILGRRRYIPNPWDHSGERYGLNTVIQGSAADLLKQAILNCREFTRTENVQLNAQIYDSLTFEVSPKWNMIQANRDEVERHVTKAMVDAGSMLSVPIEVDLAWGPDWGSAEGK